MEAARKTALGVSLFATVFVIGAAIYTRNSGLFILAAVSASSTLMLWIRRGQ